MRTDIQASHRDVQSQVTHRGTLAHTGRCFVAPRDAARTRIVLWAQRRDHGAVLTRFLALFAHPLRIEILERLVQKPSTPTELATALGASVGVVLYHTRRLEEAGFAELLKQERPKGRRGHPKSYFRADPPRISDEDWMAVPPALREALADAALRELAAGARAPDLHDPAHTPTSSYAASREELAGLLGLVATALLTLIRRDASRTLAELA